MFVGDRILAVAATSEALAQEAIDKIKVEMEPLPFVIDPLDSLYPGGKDARTDGNVISMQQVKSIKWTAADFASAGDSLPMGASADEWSFGDVDAGFKAAKVVLDESFVTAALSHHCLEPRSAMAYWENGKCFVYGSLQSQTAGVPGLARMAGIEPDDLVFVAEFCGGGFGSKINPYPAMGVPIHMAKKIGRPVMMRVSRAEEGLFGSSRPAFQGRIKIGFRGQRSRDGRRRLHRAAERPVLGRWRLRRGGRRHLAAVPAAGHALSRRGGQHEHHAHGRAARSGSEPDRRRDRAAARQGREGVRDGSRAAAPHQRRGQQVQVRRHAGPGHQRVSARGDRARRGGVQLGRSARRAAARARLEGHGYRHRPGVPLGGAQRLRRSRAHHAGRQAAHPLGRRQPRHVLLRLHVARRGRGAEMQMGELHHRTRRHAPRSAVVVVAVG